MMFAVLPLLLALPAEPPSSSLTSDEPETALAAPADGVNHEPDLPVTKMTVTPAAAPRPALSIELLPPLQDKTAGNAALAYSRALLMLPQTKAGTNAEANQQQIDQLYKWTEETPTAALPRDEVKQRLAAYQNTLKEIERAARCEQCDWDTLSRIREDGFATLLPGVQETRELAKILALRCKLEIAEGRYGDAAKSLRLGFQMAKHVGESPTLIQLLVGLAIENVFLERVEEWIATPGSPNLYWALSVLPNPLVDPRLGFAGEASFMQTIIPDHDRLRSGVIPHDEAATLVARTFLNLQEIGVGPGGSNDLDMWNGPLARLGMAGYLIWTYPSARAELIARGRPAAEVEKMAGAQVVFLNSFERYMEFRDDQWKWVGLPFHQAYPAMRQTKDRLQRAMSTHDTDLFFRLFTMILPASEKVIEATARVDRRVAALRAVEAVRLYAAENNGRVPSSLAECSVPVATDPFTGKPFEYKADGPTFTLSGPPPAGADAGRHNTIRFEVTVTPAK